MATREQLIERWTRRGEDAASGARYTTPQLCRMVVEDLERLGEPDPPDRPWVGPVPEPGDPTRKEGPDALKYP